MAEISGENGQVYFNEELTDTAASGTLTFSTSKTIVSSTTGLHFTNRGYVAGMLVAVSGCTYDAESTGNSTTGNNRRFTITVVSSGQLTVSEAVTAAASEASTGVTFEEAEPGINVLGFFNWTLSHTGDALETTDFDNSSGGRSYIAGLTGWTATADKYFLTANNEVDDWVGTAVEIRLFIDYYSSTSTPSTGTPSQYWKGDTIVTGIDKTTPVDALVNQSVSFQGDGALTLKTQTKLWNEGIST